MLDLDMIEKSMENKSIDLKKIIKMVMDKLDTIDTSLDRLTNKFKEMKECSKELKKLCLSPPLSLSMKEDVKR